MKKWIKDFLEPRAFQIRTMKVIGDRRGNDDRGHPARVTVEPKLVHNLHVGHGQESGSIRRRQSIKDPRQQTKHPANTAQEVFRQPPVY